MGQLHPAFRFCPSWVLRTGLRFDFLFFHKAAPNVDRDLFEDDMLLIMPIFLRFSSPSFRFAYYGPSVVRSRQIPAFARTVVDYRMAVARGDEQRFAPRPNRDPSVFARIRANRGEVLRLLDDFITLMPSETTVGLYIGGI